MRKKWLWLLLIPVIILLVIVIIFLVERSHVELYEYEKNDVVTISDDDVESTSANISETDEGESNNIEDISKEDIGMRIEIQIGNNCMTADLGNSIAAENLTELLLDGEIVMSASNYGGFEKVCKIGQSISRADEQITTEPGDIMLYNGNQIVIF